MPGRALIPEALITRPYIGAQFVRRRSVLRETIQAFTDQSREHFHHLAAANLARWRDAADTGSEKLTVSVIASDWGEATLQWTQKTGEKFAVLNMANAFVPGGGYVEGCPAQEENMFRRTDCHFSITEEEMEPGEGRYRPHKTGLLNGKHGRVYLDTGTARACIRGPEDRSRADLGYDWLAQDQVFPFYELRAAARDLRHGGTFDPVDAAKRIGAQLDTLRDADVQHAVLSAFGCGAFCNPADEVARIYREQIEARRADFRCIVFAIFYPGYGPDNFTPFVEAFRDWSDG